MNNILVNGKLGYDHKIFFQNMNVEETLPKKKKLKLDKSNSDEGKQTTKEYSENDQRHNICLWGYMIQQKMLDAINKIFKQLIVIIILEYRFLAENRLF